MSWLIANTLVAALLALLALALGRLRIAPAVMHALWLFVVLKLVTPPLFAVPIDVEGLFGSAPVAAPVIVVPLEAALAAAAHPPTADPVAPTWSWTTLAVAAWAIGAVTTLAWFALGLWRAQRRLRALGPVPEAWRHEIERLAAQLDVRVPLVGDDPDAAAPYVWSFGRTRLLVPVRALAAATAKGRAAVLAHELAHVRRRDHWLVHGELLLAALLWWHPLFWFARARMRLWGELACDAWAVACVPDATLDYATVLVDAAATPDSAAIAPAVLAARPAARAAFERRLTMILNENVPHRASRAWWLPMSALALGLFTVPVAAQRRGQEPARVEIRVNGKQVEELSASERAALLRKLLHAEERAAAAEPADVDAPPAEPPKRRLKWRTLVVPPDAAQGDAPQGADQAVRDAHMAMRQALAEARQEIEGDDDLRELGVTSHVVRLLDDLGDGKGIDDSLPELIKAAMHGAGKLALREIEADEDLRQLGIGKGVAHLVEGLLGDERLQEKLGDLVTGALHGALEEAHAEIHGNADLKRLGLTDDVEGLLQGVLHGHGDFDAHLQHLMQKALHAAQSAGEPPAANDDGVGDEPPAPPAKPKQRKRVRVELR